MTDDQGAVSAPIDPRDWDALRALGHRVVDEALWHLRTVRDRPVWQRVPDEVRARLAGPVPRTGIGEERTYEEFVRDILPYPVGNTHPRFWGWVIGSGSPAGVLAELLAATMNANVSGLQGSPRYVEDQVLGWLKELLDFPHDGSGILLSGGSMANMVGLAVGLGARAGYDVGRRGLWAALERPVLYASTQTHFSVEKAARTLGLGTEALRYIPVDADFRMDIAALEEAIRGDRAAGHRPFAVVGNAGTVNTGAFDDLEAIAKIAQREAMWFHVDAAFGAFAALDGRLSNLTRGMTRADSLAFDLHKWMVVPIEAGAVLLRDPAAHRAAFTVSGGYVSGMPGGIGEDSVRFAELGPQLTRSFRALKVWFALKAHGADAYAALVRRNVEHARYLYRRVQASDTLEVLAPAPLNVVNFRLVVPGWDETSLNALNRDLVVRLQEDGIAGPSHTVLQGRFSIRVCVTNHRTRREDLDLFLRETIRIGGELAATARPAAGGIGTAGTPAKDERTAIEAS